MRKEIETTEEAIFCDICGNEIRDAYWSYGGHASAEEETRKCSICHRDTCPKCRKSLDLLDYSASFRSNVACLECISLNAEVLKELADNKALLIEQEVTLRKEYEKKEKVLKKNIKQPVIKENQ